ncbi:MAG TPA: 3-hydroxyacyl-CoA dehydrogenase NAD-binding domain-containing protein [Clostridia bacterium]|nr:MAG: putative 3-hydroxybutyryl-CoA dehydrogenase [Firmicutes bacterium ADurb.Bin248]HOG00122.1 3-hydroxyacyl-CoA dehydrogenase NAD-binding domain-containing protein [Clostridia bacterium]HOS18915.1 3-hydroxyacyl-CoA dehydrogenase NAD-binding domain-containing protein [Clostridia bacterium]HPK15136.1 3-hydroxyacyl-CoA dehydrogenase NAD-binding domain-containing protein [Clostridia bacterium]
MFEQVAVIGAGTMGLDIAQCFASAGRNVIVRDVSEAIVSAAKARLTGALERSVAKGRLAPGERDKLLENISFTTELADCAGAQLAVEAIVERAEVKKLLFAELSKLLAPGAVLASNTSSISITEIASAATNPQRVVGMHFFNPATVMKLVEVIRGAFTSDETFALVKAEAEAIGKTPVEVNEAPGFVVNRLLIPMLNEAVGIWAEGVASAADIDAAMKLGCNHPMGPLALADLVGLDVVLSIMETLHRETGDGKYRPHPKLRQLVRAGTLGRKTGKGVFDYR